MTTTVAETKWRWLLYKMSLWEIVRVTGPYVFIRHWKDSDAILWRPSDDDSVSLFKTEAEAVSEARKRGW